MTAAEQGAGDVLIRQGGLSGRWYAITAWHHEGSSIVADKKHDVTEQIASLLAATADSARADERAKVAEAIEAQWSNDPGWHPFIRQTANHAARIARDGGR